MLIGSTPLDGCIGLFLKNFFSNFRSYIKDYKWGRKCIFINCTGCNRSPNQFPFQFANGKLPCAEYSQNICSVGLWLISKNSEMLFWKHYSSKYCLEMYDTNENWIVFGWQMSLGLKSDLGKLEKSSFQKINLESFESFLGFFFGKWYVVFSYKYIEYW